MGRELRRVPLDFKWPMKVIWKGYVNPYNRNECKSCDGSGLNEATKRISDAWYGNDSAEKRVMDRSTRWCNDITQDEVQALVDAGRLHDFTRVPRNEEQRKIVEQKLKDGGNSWTPEPNGYIPTAAEVNEWSKKGMGHDSVNQWICVKARAKRLGVYGDCDVCSGTGELWCDDKYEKLCDEWESIEPPRGDGYQLWSTTSDGSPDSPVFKTLEELCAHAEVHCTTFGYSRASKEEWMRMLDSGFVHHKEGNAVFI